MSQSSNTGDAASAKASTPVSSGSDDASEYVTLDEIDTSGPPKPKSPVPVLPRAVARASVRDEDIQRVKTPTKVAQPPKSSPKQSPVVSEKEKPSAEPARVSPAVSVASSFYNEVGRVVLIAPANRASIDAKPALHTSSRDVSEKTREFYSRQNSIIELFEEVETQRSVEHPPPLSQGLEDDDDRLPVKIAIRASFAVNIFLVFLKIFIAVRSNSMSVLASALDSVLDIVSGSIIFVIAWLTAKQDKYSYPVGKKRLEPLGIIVFSTLMFTTALQILIEALKRLMNHSTKINIEIYTLGGLVTTIVLKLGLYLYCRGVSGSSSVEALAQDHRNDVISNSVTIATALAAFYKPDLWWMDPIGGIAIGLYIMVVWVRTGFLTVRMLTGYVAPPDLIKKWTYLALQHHPSVIAIDTVRGYHTSEGFIVELDIVLPENMPLKEAHDIGEALQFKVEALEEVDRCFVHLDYETDHKPEH